MRYLFAIIIALLGIGGMVWWNSEKSLKVRVAVELMGWDGLFQVTKETIAHRLIGSKMTNSRRKFHEVVDMITKAELEYLVPTRRVLDAETIAEGHRFLSHIISTGFRLFYEAELEAPRFESIVGPYSKVLGDNPDAYYYSSVILKTGEYLIKGKKGEEDYLSFTVYESPCVGCFTNKVISDVNDRQIKFNGDGKSFEIYVANENKKNHPNFMSLKKMTQPQAQIITRHYYERVHHAQNTSCVPPITQ